MDSNLLDLPLEVKIYVKPKSSTVFCRGKLGEKLHGPCLFNLDDPYIRRMSLQYNCLHDPHLQDYHKRKDILWMLKRQGVITRDNKVVCTVKEFNEYRHYLTRIKLQSEQFLRQQEKSKESPLKSGRLRRGKIGLDKGQTYSRAELGTAADSQRKLDNTADSLFKAVFEQLTAAEAQKLQELVETVVHEIFGRLRVPLEHYVNFLRRAARRIRGIVFSGCVKTETSLDHRQEMEMVGKELVATVLEILGNHLESKASEPGRAARRKEKPFDGRAIRADKSKDAEADRARLHTCFDKLTRQVVKNVRCLLKSMVASQFEGGSCCDYTEILKLPKGKVSNRQMQSRFHGAPEEQSWETSTGVKLPPLGTQLQAKGTGYAKTMETKNPAMVKERLLYRPCPYFTLDDPYCHHQSPAYNCLHDPHLQDYHKRNDVLQLLKRQGFVTSENDKSKESPLKSEKSSRSKIGLDKGQTYSKAVLGQEDASTATESQRKLDNTAVEAQKLQELVEAIVYKVFARLVVPRDQHVNFLRNVAQGIRESIFSSSMRTEPAETTLDHRQEIEVVAKELLAMVLESLADHLESESSEPGRATSQEQPVDGGATQADTSKEAETASDRGRIPAALNNLTILVVENVHWLLKSMIASQFEGDSSCECTEILEFPKGKVSKRWMQPGFPGASKQQSQEVSMRLKLHPLGPQLHAEEAGHAKTMEPENPAMVKERLVREVKEQPQATLQIQGPEQKKIVQSILGQICKSLPVPPPEKDFQ
ncbi:hypothetical protein DUI87_27673 [Hirundo rustica rustica]|uniref:Uncharacterized protein n=1 Tax=Hirundo rustica rustica TaxID=333673 RepID=A0A3M0J9J9_HIRRU|nr:hypothetical protein DUI87_27673 [Hirundo rustica rustica]